MENNNKKKNITQIIGIYFDERSGYEENWKYATLILDGLKYFARSCSIFRELASGICGFRQHAHH